MAVRPRLGQRRDEQRQRLKSIGPDGFAVARSRLQQAEAEQKVIGAEIVTDATVG